MGYFYWLRVKSSNYLHTELSLGYLKGTKFYLESNASFIDISSIASFKPLLHFLDSSVVKVHGMYLKIYQKVCLKMAKKDQLRAIALMKRKQI